MYFQLYKKTKHVVQLCAQVLFRVPESGKMIESGWKKDMCCVNYTYTLTHRKGCCMSLISEAFLIYQAQKCSRPNNIAE